MRSLTKSLTILKFVLLAYFLWKSRELYSAWTSSPNEYGAWIAFVIWLSPLILIFFIPQKSYLQKEKETFIVLGIAILFSLLGTLGEFYTFNYFSLALTISTFLPPSWIFLLWIPFAITWMPAYGWITTQYIPKYIFITRVILALISVLLTILLTDRGYDE